MSTNPFHLGLKGEYWEPELPGLVIPLGDGKSSIVVVAGVDGFGVVGADSWEHTDNLFMAAAIARNIVDEFYKDDPSLLRKMAVYIETHKEK